MVKKTDNHKDRLLRLTNSANTVEVKARDRKVSGIDATKPDLDALVRQLHGKGIRIHRGVAAGPVKGLTKTNTGPDIDPTAPSRTVPVVATTVVQDENPSLIGNGSMPEIENSPAHETPESSKLNSAPGTSTRDGVFTEKVGKVTTDESESLSRDSTSLVTKVNNDRDQNPELSRTENLSPERANVKYDLSRDLSPTLAEDRSNGEKTGKDPATGRFLPGNPGGGRPKGLVSLIRTATRDGAELVEFMIKVARGDSSVGFKVKPGQRIEAVNWLTERMVGKPTAWQGQDAESEPVRLQWIPPESWNTNQEELK